MRLNNLVLLSIICFAVNISPVSAQLNSNPWVQANDEEAVAAVYAKKQRRIPYGKVVTYQQDNNVTIDRTHAYIQDDPAEAPAESLLDKVKNSLSGKPQETETPLIPNTKENRQKVAAQKQAAAAAKAEQDESDSGFSVPDTLNIAKQTAELKRTVSRPVNKAKNMFNKFKRSAAGSLRAIGKQFK